MECRNCQRAIIDQFKDKICISCYVKFYDFVVHKQYVDTDVPESRVITGMTLAVKEFMITQKIAIDFEIPRVALYWDEWSQLQTVKGQKAI